MKIKNLGKRALVGVGICLILVVGVFTPEAWLIRLAYCLAAILGYGEIESFYKVLPSPSHKAWRITVVVQILLVTSTLAALFLPAMTLFLCIVSTYTCDAVAYFTGNLVGGEYFPKHPLKISPSKTIEGLIAGCASGMIMGLAFYTLINEPDPCARAANASLILAGFAGTAGDLLESYLKRAHNVKDSCDKLIQVHGFRTIEGLLGGAEGHGGYLDRVDSLTVTLTLTNTVFVIAQFLR